VTIKTVKRYQCRFLRATLTISAVLRAALAENAPVYHLHDFELIPVGLVLRALGKRVIYDVHEDVSTQTLIKEWLPQYCRSSVARLAVGLEGIADRVFDGIVVATETIGARFSSSKSFLVRNFVQQSSVRTTQFTPYRYRPRRVVYAGINSRRRGLIEMVRAIGMVRPPVELVLLGSFSPPNLLDECRGIPGGERTVPRGHVLPSEVLAILAESRVGIAVLHPTRNYIDSLPTKIFEYMHAGLPVVVSNFPILASIVHGSDCGLVVDPLDPAAIACAIGTLLDNPESAEAMGRRGREAVLREYSWDSESVRLIECYGRLLAAGHRSKVP
jgi:glycosyltransferase involved in cell wall biosynthesis